MSLILPLLLAALTAPPSAAQDPLQEDRLAADLEFLADDALQGRDSAAWGGHAAARFLATRFEQIGLQPVGEDWLHAFSVKPLQLNLESSFLQLEDHRFDVGRDFIPHPAAPTGKVTGRLVFAGYGIQKDEFKDQQGHELDLEDAIVLLLRYESQAKLGQALSADARLRNKVLELQKRGAAAVLLAPSASEAHLPGPSRAAGWFLWPSQSPLVRSWKQQLAKPKTSEAYTRMNLQHSDAEEVLFSEKQGMTPLGVKIPVAYVSLTVAEQIRSHEQVSIHIKLSHQANNTAFNVVGLLPGRHADLSEELLLIGAHYDHLGMNQNGEIWNGADDNASGVAAMLALAEYFSKEKHRPQRSMVFVGFSGEERGLVGASAFLRQRTVDLERIALMMNFEMMGHARNQSFAMIGSHSGVGLEDLIPRERLPLSWSYEENHKTFFHRSDQAPFQRFGVPTLLFTTGEHEDYHRPSDTAENINLAGLSIISRFAAHTLEAVDAAAKSPEFVDYLGLHTLIFGAEPKHQGTLPLPFRQNLAY